VNYADRPSSLQCASNLNQIYHNLSIIAWDLVCDKSDFDFVASHVDKIDQVEIDFVASVNGA